MSLAVPQKIVGMAYISIDETRLVIWDASGHRDLGFPTGFVSVNWVVANRSGVIGLTARQPGRDLIQRPALWDGSKYVVGYTAPVTRHDYYTSKCVDDAGSVVFDGVGAHGFRAGVTSGIYKLRIDGTWQNLISLQEISDLERTYPGGNIKTIIWGRCKMVNRSGSRKLVLMGEASNGRGDSFPFYIMR
jgi:hypothetical protein